MSSPNAESCHDASLQRSCPVCTLANTARWSHNCFLLLLLASIRLSKSFYTVMRRMYVQMSMHSCITPSGWMLALFMIFFLHIFSSCNKYSYIPELLLADMSMLISNNESQGNKSTSDMPIWRWDGGRHFIKSWKTAKTKRTELNIFLPAEHSRGRDTP